MSPVRSSRFAMSLLLGAASLGALPACTLIVDADGYPTCIPGTEACACRAEEACEEGLRCQDAGVCERADE